MKRHCDFAADLLRAAAQFYRQIGEVNPNIANDLEQNAKTFEAAAHLVETDPTGAISTS